MSVMARARFAASFRSLLATSEGWPGSKARRRHSIAAPCSATACAAIMPSTSSVGLKAANAALTAATRCATASGSLLATVATVDFSSTSLNSGQSLPPMALRPFGGAIVRIGTRSRLMVFPQAVVGNIGTGGGGGATEMREEPCGAPARLAHDTAIGAVLPALWRADAERDTMPVACDEEPPPLPPARRAQHGTEDS
jgi:hypothetical protein